MEKNNKIQNEIQADPTFYICPNCLDDPSTTMPLKICLSCGKKA
tara:strand:+ start:236 stop:367 length:132 start_codon:yes stop_codon:yes gene_type:complete